MYNVRKKLWILMLLLFAVSTALLPFTRRQQAENSVASAAMTGTEDAAIPYGDEVLSDGDLLNGSGAERFVAHRGYSGYAPENSVPAFELAGRTGFWGIETDISETSDGAFVCMHDETIDRTTDGEGAVGDYTLEQLGNFEIDYGNYLRTTENLKIPTMQEYLEICRRYGCVAIVEIKTISDYDAFLAMINDYNMLGKCVITGEINDMKEIRARNSSVPVMTIGYYPGPYTDNLRDIAEISGSRGVLYNYPQVEQHVVEELHGQNVYCAVWSVDDVNIAKEYLGYGVDFIVTNEIPARLSYMVNENE